MLYCCNDVGNYAERGGTSRSFGIFCVDVCSFLGACSGDLQALFHAAREVEQGARYEHKEEELLLWLGRSLGAGDATCLRVDGRDYAT